MGSVLVGRTVLIGATGLRANREAGCRRFPAFDRLGPIHGALVACRLRAVKADDGRRRAAGSWPSRDDKTRNRIVPWCSRTGTEALAASGLPDRVRRSTEVTVRWYLSFCRRSRVGAVTSSTQRQALNALVFLLGKVAGLELGDFGDYARAEARSRMPVVLTRDEIRRLLDAMDGSTRLMAQVMYGGGLRLLESLRLRVKDLDLERRQITVRFGKGAKDRVTTLPEAVLAELGRHLERLRPRRRTRRSCRPRLASSPEWQIFTKRPGRMCRAKRRTNSGGSSVIVL